MSTLRKIKILQLEPTDVCQAACPLCARETDSDFDHSQQHHLDMSQVLAVFDRDLIPQLEKMFMCGNYGDPAAGRHTMDMFKEFRAMNKNIVLGMHSNGAIQNTLWWHELGLLFNQPNDYVVFSIDGLETTNSVYRKNVSWPKVMANAEAFISAGGTAHWDMLVYRHNQHQVEEAEQLARTMGFRWFRAKVSKRGFTDQLQAPINWHDPRVTSNNIVCTALKEQSLYIDAQGRVSHCCWFGARQKNFETDFDSVQQSWASSTPHAVCVVNCGSVAAGSSFNLQWQKEVQLS